jgi:hypothetical protein
MLYPIGSKVKLAALTGDDQIDYYYGQVLTVSKPMHEIAANYVDRFLSNIDQYEVVTSDGFALIVNEYELEAA